MIMFRRFHVQLGWVWSLLLLLVSSSSPSSFQRWLQTSISVLEDDDDDSLFMSNYPPIRYPTAKAIDFRDLFLPPQEAAALGGSGVQPYGDVVATHIWPFLQNISDPEYEKKSDVYDNKINADVIEPFTETQSGINGTIIYPSEIVNYTVEYKYALGDLKLKLSDFRVHNLNTVVPLQIMVPAKEPHILTNSFFLGGTNPTNNEPVIDDEFDRTIEILARLSLAIRGETPLETENVVDISFRIPNSQYLLDFLLLIDAPKFLLMPLDLIQNPACWFNTLKHDTNDDPVHLQNFQAALTSLLVNVTCVSCDDNMQEFLPELMNTLQSSVGDNSYMSTITEVFSEFLEDGVWNMWEIIDLTRMIQEISTLCPLHPEYNATLATVITADTTTNASAFAVPLYLTANPPTPTLSRSSFESVIAVAILTLETIMATASQRYLAMEEELPTVPPIFDELITMPPVLEQEYDDESNNTQYRYLDWRELNSTLERLKSNLEPDQIKELLLLDEDGALVVSLDNVTMDSGMGHILTLESFRIQGLELLLSRQQLDNILQVVGPYELESEWHLPALTIEALATVTTTSDYPGEPMLKPENMTITLHLTDLHVLARLFLQVDLEKLGNLQLWTILQGFDTAIPCILATARRISLQALDVNAGYMEPLNVSTGYLPDDLVSMVNGIGHDIFETHGENIAAGITPYFRFTVRHIVNEIMQEQYKLLTANSSSACIVEDPSMWDGFMDFRALFLGEGETTYGPLCQNLYEYLEEAFFTPEGVESINSLIAGTTEEQSGVEGALNVYEGSNVSAAFEVGNLVGRYFFDVSNVTIVNVDSLGMPFRLIYPNDTHLLDQNMSVGVGSRPLTLGANFVLKVSDDEEMNIDNTMQFGFGLDTFNIFLRVLLLVPEEAFLTFPLKSITNIYCWLALIPPEILDPVDSTLEYDSGIAVEDLEWSTEDTVLQTDCINCTSPYLPELIRQLYNITQGSFEQIREIVMRVSGKTKGAPLVPTITKQILEHAPFLCPHSPEYDPNATISQPFLDLDVESASERTDSNGRNPNTFFLDVFFFGFGMLVLLTFVAARFFVHVNNKKRRSELSEEANTLLCRIEERERECNDYLDKTMVSLYKTKFVPTHARYLVPIITVADMILFAMAHTLTTYTISMDVHFAGDDFIIHDIFAFNFADGVRNTFRNGGYEMAIMLLLFAGVWPYLRCLMTLFLWFFPPKWLPASYRGRLLIWIDAMNKLTVNDILKFLLVIAIVFIFFGGPYVFGQAKTILYAIRLILVPGPALYSGTAAVTISRMSSVWVLDYHNTAMDSARKAYHEDHVDPVSYGVVDAGGVDGTESELEESIAKPEVAAPGSRHFIIFGKHVLLGEISLAMGVFAVLLLVIIGLVFVPAVAIDVSAIVELILESGTTYEDAVSHFGVYALMCAVLIKARLLMESVTDYVATAALLGVAVVALYFLVVVGITRWARFVYEKGWRRLLLLFLEKDPEVVEIPEYLRLHGHKHFAAWVVAFTIGVFQLGAVTIYSIHNFCSLLDSIYGFLAYAGIIPETSGQCWVAQVSQVHNLIVFFGCLFYLAFNLVVQLTTQYKVNILRVSRMLRYQDCEDSFIEKLSHALKKGDVKRDGPFKNSISESFRTNLLLAEQLDVEGDERGSQTAGRVDMDVGTAENASADGTEHSKGSTEESDAKDSTPLTGVDNAVAGSVVTERTVNCSTTGILTGSFVAEGEVIDEADEASCSPVVIDVDDVARVDDRLEVEC